MSNVNPVPDRFHTLTPYIFVEGAGKAVEFYKAAFGAEEISRMEAPGGVLLHAEVCIGNSMLMLSEANPDWGSSPPQPGKNHGSLHLYVEDADAAFARAVQAGCTELAPVQDMFWGDRFGKVMDPFGHHWSVATHVRDVTEEEMAKAAAAMFAEPDCQKAEEA